MPRYNIALVPNDAAFAADLTRTAQSLFAGRSDGYLLGKNALPHLTLCQFRARDDDHALAIAQSWKAAGSQTVTNDGFVMRPRAAGNVNASINTIKTQELDQLQETLVEHIRSQGGETLTASGKEFWPHFTMAYVKPDVAPAHEQFSALLGRQTVRPVLGISDEAGQMTSVIRTLRPI